MDCEYCHIAMEPIGMGVCNGWRCPNCKHEEVEMGSWKLANEPVILPCNCSNCHVNKLDDMDFREFNLKLYNLFKAGCAAREKMFNGNRTEAMRIYKLIGEDLRIWGEYLRKLVF
jgi:hypothetical protein